MPYPPQAGPVAINGHYGRPWRGRSAVYGAAPFPTFGYAGSYVEPALAARYGEPPLNAPYGHTDTQYYGYGAPTPCAAPVIIVINSGVQGGLTPPVVQGGGGGCSTPVVIHQAQVYAQPRVIQAPAPAYRKAYRRTLSTRY